MLTAGPFYPNDYLFHLYGRYNLTILRLLLSNGGKIKSTNKSKQTLLHYSALYCEGLHEEEESAVLNVMEYLLKQRLEIDAVDALGATALMYDFF